MALSMKRMVRSIAIICAIIGGTAIGLVQSAASPALAADETDAALQDIRPDLKEVLYSLTYRIQGVDFEVSPNLLFDTEIGEIADPTGLSYKFLNLQDVALMKFEDRGADSFELLAVLKFADAMNRQAFLSVAAQYTARDGVIYVEEAVVEPFYSPRGNADVVLAPSDALPDFAVLQDMTLEELYLTMKENAVAAADTLSSNGSQPETLTVLVFDRVRTHPDTALAIVARDDPKPALAQQARINQEGWPYTLIEADFVASDSLTYEVFRVDSESRGGGTAYLGEFIVGGRLAN